MCLCVCLYARLTLRRVTHRPCRNTWTATSSRSGNSTVMITELELIAERVQTLVKDRSAVSTRYNFYARYRTTLYLFSRSSPADGKPNLGCCRCPWPDLDKCSSTRALILTCSSPDQVGLKRCSQQQALCSQLPVNLVADRDHLSGVWGNHSPFRLYVRALVTTLRRRPNAAALPCSR